MRTAKRIIKTTIITSITVKTAIVMIVGLYVVFAYFVVFVLVFYLDLWTFNEFMDKNVESNFKF